MPQQRTTRMSILKPHTVDQTRRVLALVRVPVETCNMDACFGIGNDMA